MSVTVTSRARPRTPHSHVGDQPEVIELTATAETYDLAVAALRAQLPDDYILLGISSDLW